MSTQLIGFSTGGVVKRFLVSPPSMSWSTVPFVRPSSRADMMGAFDPSLASEPRHMRAFQYSSLSGLLGFLRLGNEPRAFLLLWFPCLLHLVYVRSVLFPTSAVELVHKISFPDIYSPLYPPSPG